MNQFQAAATPSVNFTPADLPDTTNIHTFSEQDVSRVFQTTRNGLSNLDAQQRLEIFGLNVLPEKSRPTIFRIFLHQFLSPLIYILLVAGLVSFLIGERTDAGFIFAIILLNAALGTFQEWKAEQSAAALQSLLTIRTRVRREGVEKEIAAEQLVPGDICLLESGLRIPADLRLIETTNLAVDESLLTGESLAVTKSSAMVGEPDAPLSDRTDMGYGATTVMVGRAVGVVVGTGSRTEVAKIAKVVAETEETKPPLVVRMDHFARVVSIGILGACLLLAVVAVNKGIPLTQVFFMAVALAVSAIPEGLPVAMTVALSVASSRMAKRHVIVRKLTAVEGLGSCTYIASDKTGTLTVNQQTVKKLVLPNGEQFDVSGQGYTGEGKVTCQDDSHTIDKVRSLLQRLGKVGLLCNEAQLTCERGEWIHHGDAVDIALLALGYKLEMNPSEIRQATPIVGLIPFESERQFAAAFYREDDVVHVAVKGGMEVVLSKCSSMATLDGDIPIHTQRLEEVAIELAATGYRVLVLAEGRMNMPLHDDIFDEQCVPPLTVLGLIASIDPLRSEVKEAVEKCRGAGVQVAMVTGDHPATALSISRELGIASTGQEVATGPQLMKVGEESLVQFFNLIKRIKVFARMTPLQKYQIVDALVQQGQFVAVTGDGVNDAPALRKAHLGVAMGSGTDVAKDSAAMIITDDRFTSIVAGIEEGRFAYDNIRKVIALLIACGAAEILLFTVAIVMGLPLPLTAVQLLWLNLVTNGPQDVALAFETGEVDAMTRKPRKPSEGIFDRLMIQQTLVAGCVMGVVASGVWYWCLMSGWEEAEARNLLLLLMVFLENVHVFNCRSERYSAFQIPLRSNWILLFGVVAVQGIHILALYVPVTQDILNVSPVTLGNWGSLLLLASTILVAMEIFKAIKRRTTSHSFEEGIRG